MKNIINYYYGILVSKVVKNKDTYIFVNNDIEYEFTPERSNESEMLNAYKIALENQKYIHELVVNKFNTVFTVYNNKEYILIKKYYNSKSKININNILSFNTAVLSLNTMQYFNKYNWIKLWIDKIDYYEYQMKESTDMDREIKYLLSYYIGLSENAVSLMSYADTRNVGYGVCHYRLRANDTQSKLYNPTEILIDIRCRDICEYLKSIYFDTKISDNNFNEIFEKAILSANYNYDEMISFFSRLLFPTYFFDIYEMYMLNNKDLLKIINFTKKIHSYELILKLQYLKFQKVYNLPIIDWFNQLN